MAIPSKGRESRCPETGRSDALAQQGCQRFDAGAILSIEARQAGTVEVDHCHHCAIAKHWDDQFGSGARIAGDVPGEGVHVGNKLRFSGRSRPPADARAERNADAGGFAAERAEHKLAFDHAIKSRPVGFGQGMPQQGGDIGHIGDRVRLVGSERIGSVQDIAVKCWFREMRVEIEVEHGAILSARHCGGQPAKRLPQSA